MDQVYKKGRGEIDLFSRSQENKSFKRASIDTRAIMD